MTNLYFSQFLTIAIVHFFAVASPGPDFAVIVRQSIAHGKQTGIWTSIGVGCGILVHVSYSLFGLGVIVSQSIVLFNVLKIMGGMYLVYIGLKTLRARPKSEAMLVADGGKESTAQTAGQAIWTGFLTNGLNPKATLFFLSLFTVVINPETPFLIQAGYGVYMAVATAVWFSGVSLFLGHPLVRQKFFKLGHWFDRITGAVLIALGVKLAFFSR